MGLKTKELLVGDYMTSYPISVEPDISLQKVVDFMADKHIPSIIVMEKNRSKPSGILTERGILHYLVKEGNIPNIPVGDVIIQPFASVTPDTTILDTAKLMISKKSRVLVFADKDKLVGKITSFDMLGAIKKADRGISLKKVISTKFHHCSYDTSILDAAKILHTKKIGSVMVEKDSSYAIFTQRDIIKVLKKKVDLNSKVGKHASFPLVTAKNEILVNEAAKIMMAKNIKRLALTTNGSITGIVTARDLVNAFQMDEVMKKSTQSKEEDGICPICKKLKNKHSVKEMKACTRKELEFAKNKKGGSGIK